LPAIEWNPVVVGVLYTDDNPVGDEPETRVAALAAQSYINSHGGIGGRTLKVVPCNGKNDPQTDVQCATEFVNDGAVAVHGLDGEWGSAGVSIIAKASRVG
jgi:ABC-type branched-subunit amino acid transport system substrate-binding protein